MGSMRHSSLLRTEPNKEAVIICKLALYRHTHDQRGLRGGSDPTLKLQLLQRDAFDQIVKFGISIPRYATI